MFCSACICTAFHLLLLCHPVWQGLQEMLFTDNSPLLHWLLFFDNLSLSFIRKRCQSTLFPLPPPHFSFLHPFPRAHISVLDSTDPAQPIFLESPPCDFSLMCELTFYCYLCSLCLNQVIIQSGGFVLMQLQHSFHKSLWSGTLLDVIRKVDSISPVQVLVLPFKYSPWEHENW